MPKVALVTDSVTYLPKELVEKYAIRIVPVMIIWSGVEQRDGIDILPKEFYTRLQSDPKMPSTSQPPPIEFKKVFDELLAEGHDILAIMLSSKFSGTYASAKEAQGMLPGANIEVIDSLTGSMGIGWPMLHVAQAAEKGASLAECKALAQKAVKNTGILLTVDTLEFLHRGGRIGGAQRFLGDILSFKPILEVVDGAFLGLERVRTRQKALNRLVDLLETRIAGRKPVRLAALHANAPELADQLLREASARVHPVETLIAEVSPAVGVHLGPGTVGYAFMAGIE